MAKHRPNLYIHATWLAKVMSGEVACQWQFWFQTHNQLEKKQPSTFDRVGWNINHTRMLTELTQELTTSGLNFQKEHSFNFEVPSYKVTIGCRTDCIAFSDSLIEIYDCKTGKPRNSDQVQVMIYMHAISQNPKINGRKIRGYVVYEETKLEIPELPDSFASNFDYFVGLLASNIPLLKVPGKDCRFCSITRTDCPERLDIPENVSLDDDVSFNSFNEIQL